MQTLDMVSTTAALSGDNEVFKVAYVYGSFTGTYSNLEHSRQVLLRVVGQNQARTLYLTQYLMNYL